MNKTIIIRPIITEKTTRLAEDAKINQYTFQVHLDANKIEIRKAVEAQFGVHVVAVNTSVRPGKRKGRIVKGRMTHGITSPVKKAVVTVAEGEFIEGFYGNAGDEEVAVDTNENAENTAEAGK